ncbi:MAG: Na+/H+ antiporter NhaC family protein [Alphaproteobacteria bacterium]
MRRLLLVSFFLTLLCGALLAALAPVQAQRADPSPDAEAPKPSLEVPRLVLSGVETTVTATGIDRDGLWRLDGSGTRRTARPSDSTVTFDGVVLSASPTLLILIAPDGTQAARLEVNPAPGWVSVLPAILAIIAVILIRQVLPALLLGIWLGAALVHGVGLAGLWNGFLDILPVYGLTALGDSDKLAILVFSIIIGGMIGILTQNGSMTTVAEGIARLARTARGGQAASSTLGLFVFFDDYANTLVVGNTMRPITDRLRVSREKLAFIVDSTAAPVATLAIVTTWIGFMVSVIDKGTAKIEGWSGSAYNVFLDSIPYSFYPLIAIGLVWLVTLSGRDFGPMLAAERRARREGVKDGFGQSSGDLSAPDGADPVSVSTGPRAPAWAAIVPLLILIFGTFTGILTTGYQADPTAATLRDLLGAGNSFTAMMWASLGAAVTAGILGMAFGGQKLEATMEGWLAGARSMMLPAVVLTLAWTLAEVNDALQTDDYLITLLGGSLPAYLLPATVFILSAGMAFTTGTSWGVMGIMTPLVVPLAWAVTAGEPAGAAIFSATIASVLGGAVWGDHCSPISDTTVMSSLAAGCDHVDHVRTQLPYAALAGAATVILGLVPIGLGVPWWIGLLLSAGTTAAVFWWLASPVEEGPSRAIR